MKLAWFVWFTLKIHTRLFVRKLRGADLHVSYECDCYLDQLRTGFNV